MYYKNSCTLKPQKSPLLQYYLEPFIIDRKEKFAKISIAVQSLKSHLNIAFNLENFIKFLFINIDPYFS